MFNPFKTYSEKERKLIYAVKQITGDSPRNIELYSLAMKHTSVAKVSPLGIRQSNERLEYLGDAILGAVVAEYLFKKFPYKNEGFLTEIRSRIVNREALNHLAIKIGLNHLVEYDTRRRKNSLSHKSLYGDAMEAFIGAYYLDRGFKPCKKFIIKKLLRRYYDLNDIVGTTINFKSKLIEWSQKNSKSVQFDIISQKGEKHNRQFTAEILVENKRMALGYGFSKKKAEQDAARKTCEKLEIV
ncbi:MAG: ribonuclease III [Flammeovirgaceae bacterium]